jgi:SAM-dependent methyltransferase
VAEFALAFEPSRADLMAVFDLKYRRGPTLGWGPKTRLRFGYFNPDDHYEAIVAKLVTDGIHWADVGCGRDVFPSNPALAAQLSKRCGILFGIDPDPNIRENPFITEGFEGVIEDCPSDRCFDLITLRMVAEHITDPVRVVAKLGQMTKPGGLVVVYTPNKWAPVSLLAASVPNHLHHRFKRLVWNAEERDTFPTAFKLNTRAALANHFSANDMSEVYFAFLDDCRTFSEFRLLSYLELLAQKTLRSFRIRYPENCLLGIYRKLV